MAEQLTFDWPTGVALGPEDFFVSSANTQAYAMVTNPASWPDAKLVVTGPRGCGKSHLCKVFQQRTDAIIIDAIDLADTLPPPPGQSVIVEDLGTLPRVAEEAMFHLHNHLRNTGGYLLMSATSAPARWPIALPDLASRVQAATVVEITDPDDALLQALIMKLFADRQIMPPPAVVAYLAPRIERSFAAAADIVAQLDAAALAQGRGVTRHLARQLLDIS